MTITPTMLPTTTGALAPSGTAVFTVDGVQHNGSVTASGANGTAAVSVSGLSVGPHTVSVTYNGDSNYSTSTTPSNFTVNVQQDNVVVTVFSTITTTTLGQPVTFSATVSAATAGSSGVPSGTVNFLDNSLTGASLGTATLDSHGNATLTPATTSLAVGVHKIFVQYIGDQNYRPGSSLNTATATVTVNKGSSSVKVTPATASSVYGQSVTFTATVSPVSPATGTPTGTVTFIVDSGTPSALSEGTVNLSGGVASITLNNLSAGVPHTIDASYSGDGNFTVGSSAHMSGTANLTVSQDTSATVVQSSSSISVFGQPVTFTATVSATGPGSGTPTGNVTFEDTSATTPTILQTNVPLNSGGVATLVYNSLPVGSRKIVALYSGDGNFTASSNAAAFAQTVNQENTSTALSTTTASPSPFGQPATFTATITANTPGTILPPAGETVTFFDGATPIGGPVATNVSGVATVSTNSLTQGQHSISATYAGDTSFKIRRACAASCAAANRPRRHPAENLRLPRTNAIMSLASPASASRLESLARPGGDPSPFCPLTATNDDSPGCPP